VVLLLALEFLTVMCLGLLIATGSEDASIKVSINIFVHCG